MTSDQFRSRRALRETLADLLVASLVSALAASGALVPLLGAGFALATGTVEALGMAFFGLVAMPFTLFAFMAGSLVIGPASFLILGRLRLANDLSAGLIAAVFSGGAALLLFGEGAPGSHLEIVAPVSLAGMIGGVVFWRLMKPRPKRPPAPPSEAPTP